MRRKIVNTELAGISKKGVFHETQKVHSIRLDERNYNRVQNKAVQNQ
ncbi:hypothetical protein [Butyrivibrio sp. VCD2006]|nr:hypothetical protein [Butyrivibrio sp. VCD2006]